MAKEGQEQTGLLGELTHPGRPRDEEPHIKRSVKKKKENIEYIVRVNLKEIGIDEITFDELQELFRMFDNDKDGVLSLKEFEKILVVLGRSGENPALLVFTTSPQEQRRPPGGPPWRFLQTRPSSRFPSTRQPLWPLVPPGAVSGTGGRPERLARSIWP